MPNKLSKPVNSILSNDEVATVASIIPENTSIPDLNRIFDKLNKGCLTHNSSGQITDFNQKALEILGVKGGELLSAGTLDKCSKTIKEDGTDFLLEDHPYMKTLKTGNDLTEVVMGLYKLHRTLIWLSLDSIKINEATVLTIITDITKQKKLQSEINMFKEALESVSYHVTIASSEGVILYANTAAEDFTGYAKEEIIGTKIGKSEPWNEAAPAEFYENMWQILAQKKEPFEAEVTNKRKNGEVYTSLLHVSPVLNSKKDILYFVSIERDISVYKEVERVKDQLETFFDLSIDMLCIANTAGRFEKINKSFVRVLGWSEEELMSTSILEFVHKEDLHNTYNMIGSLYTGEQIINFKNRYRCKSGEYKWLSWNIKPIPDGKIFATVRDVTLEEQADRMKTEFISIASHQLRTPLSAIRWYSEILSDHVARDLGDKDREYLQNIQKSNQRMIQLVSTLLNISRIESGRLMVEPQLTDLRDILESLHMELHPKLKAKRQKLSINYKTPEKSYMLDANLMRNVLMNLLTNAIKYSDEEKEINVLVREAGEDVEICVEDKGYGIPAQEQSKIFSKFFRSSNIAGLETDGTGLGLYLVKQLVELSGGVIYFESAEGQGSTFCVRYPKAGMRGQEGDVAVGS